MSFFLVSLTPFVFCAFTWPSQGTTARRGVGGAGYDARSDARSGASVPCTVRAARWAYPWRLTTAASGLQGSRNQICPLSRSSVRAGLPVIWPGHSKHRRTVCPFTQGRRPAPTCRSHHALARQIRPAHCISKFVRASCSLCACVFHVAGWACAQLLAPVLPASHHGDGRASRALCGTSPCARASVLCVVFLFCILLGFHSP